MSCHKAVNSSRKSSSVDTPAINTEHRVSKCTGSTKKSNGQRQHPATSGRTTISGPIQTHIQYCKYCEDVHKKSAFSGSDAVSCNNALDRGVPFGENFIVHEVFQAVVQPDNEKFVFEHMHSNTGGWDCLPQDITVYGGRVVISNTYAIAKVSKGSRGPSSWCAKMPLIQLDVKFCDHLHGDSPEVRRSYKAEDMATITCDIKRVNCSHPGCNTFFYYQRHACKEEEGMDVVVLKVERELSHNYELTRNLASPSSSTWTSASVSRESFCHDQEKVMSVLEMNADILSSDRSGM